MNVLILQAAKLLVGAGDGVEGLDHLGLELRLDCADREPILHIVVIVRVALADRPVRRRHLTVSAFVGGLERNGGRGRSGRRLHVRRLPGSVGANYWRRHGLGVRAGIGRVEVDDVAQEYLALVELIPPDDDGLEGEWALAEPRNHGSAAGLDALCDDDLTLARKEFDRAHFAEIHTHGVVGALRINSLTAASERSSSGVSGPSFSSIFFLRGVTAISLAMNLDDQSAPTVRLKQVFRPRYLSRGCRFRLFQDQKRGTRGGPPLP